MAVSLEENYDEEEEDLSDWEKEMDERGEVFYLGLEALLPSPPEPSPPPIAPQVSSSEPRKKGFKLSRLVRRRESKRERQAPSSFRRTKTLESSKEGGREEEDEAPEDEEEFHEEIKTFESLVEQEDARVLVEKLVVDFRTLETTGEADNVIISALKERTSVQGPRVGDWIRLMNGHRVTVHNVQSILSKYGNPVEITIQRNKPESSSCLSSYLLAAYLTQKGITDSSPEGADILYKYPPFSTNGRDILKVRGIIPTLATIVPRVTMGSKPVLTSVLVEGETLVHVAVHEEEPEDYFILAIPDEKLAGDETPTLLFDLVKSLRFRYGRLRDIFTSGRTDLDRFFHNVFDGISSAQDVAGFAPPKFQEFLRAPHYFLLPDDVKFQIDDALSQFESADFRELTEGFYDLSREFDILGSSLFHRGYIVASHLPKEDAFDIYLWLRFSGLLGITSTRTVERVVVWHRVFNPDYPKLFLLVVGSGHQLLTVLLEPLDYDGETRGDIPDPFYVDYAENTIDHLTDMGIPVVCEKWLTLPSNPDIVDVDKLFANARNFKGGIDVNAFGRAGNPKKASVVLKRTRSVECCSSGASNSSESSDRKDIFYEYEENEAEDYYEEQSTAFRGGSSSSSSLVDAAKLSSSFNKALNITDDTVEEEELVTHHVRQLSISKENTIFHYINLDMGDGIFLSPLSPPQGILHSELLMNMKASAQIIHSTFEMALKNGETLKTMENSDSPSPWLNRPLVTVKEQGVLFHWTPTISGKPSPTPLAYWVCGRLFLTPSYKECYVCYHDSAPQNIVELAFRLSFGVTI